MDMIGLFNGSGRKHTPEDTEPRKELQRGDRHTNHLLDLPKRVGFGVERVKITPELAQHYLSFNRNNWDVIPARVDQYADEMMRGEWVENGDTIRFSKDGRLIDGQHRLMAIIQSGISLHMLVAFGIEDDAQDMIDTGRRKTSRGVMTVRASLSTFEAKVAGTAAHNLINVQHGIPLTSSIKRLNREVTAFLLENPRFIASVHFIAELPRKYTPITHSKALCLHYLFAGKDVADADAFIEKLFTGDSLPKSNPIFSLRAKLNESLRAGAKPYSAREQYHACIKAWNAVRAGKSLSTPRSLFPRSDEPLPEIE